MPCELWGYKDRLPSPYLLCSASLFIIIDNNADINIDNKVILTNTNHDVNVKQPIKAIGNTIIADIFKKFFIFLQFQLNAMIGV